MLTLNERDAVTWYLSSVKRKKGSKCLCKYLAVKPLCLSIDDINIGSKGISISIQNECEQKTPYHIALLFLAVCRFRYVTNQNTPSRNIFDDQ